jgi:uncharacterized protein (UPF0332 family)
MHGETVKSVYEHIHYQSSCQLYGKPIFVTKHTAVVYVLHKYKVRKCESNKLTKCNTFIT